MGGVAKISLKGKGERLDMPALGSLALPIEVQLRARGPVLGGELLERDPEHERAAQGEVGLV